jgi:hypothetical protein
LTPHEGRVFIALALNGVPIVVLRCGFEDDEAVPDVKHVLHLVGEDIVRHPQVADVVVVPEEHCLSGPLGQGAHAAHDRGR